MPRIAARKPRKGRSLFGAWLWHRWQANLLWLIILCVGLSGWLYHRQHNIPAQLAAWALETSARAGFVVKNIYVTGRGRTEQQEVLKALGMREGDPLFLYSLTELHSRLKALPWVEGVTIRRELPDTLHLHFAERQPVALWRDGEYWYIVDASGRIVKPYEGNIAKTTMLRIYGVRAPQQVMELLDMLNRRPALAETIRAAWWVGGRRWNLYRADELEIRLPEEDAAAAWESLYQVHTTTPLLSQDIVRIDLRLQDRMIIKFKSGGEKTLAQQQQ